MKQKRGASPGLNCSSTAGHPCRPCPPYGQHAGSPGRTHACPSGSIVCSSPRRVMTRTTLCTMVDTCRNPVVNLACDEAYRPRGQLDRARETSLRDHCVQTAPAQTRAGQNCRQTLNRGFETHLDTYASSGVYLTIDGAPILWENNALLVTAGMNRDLPGSSGHFRDFPGCRFSRKSNNLRRYVATEGPQLNARRKDGFHALVRPRIWK